MDISNSDIATFNKCKRQWDLISPNRQGLVSNTTADYFFIGSAFHRCLDAQAQGIIAGVYEYCDGTIVNCIEAEMETERSRYHKINGFSMSQYEEDGIYGEAKALVRDMANRYHAHWGPHPLPGYRLLHTELTFRVRIPNTSYGWYRGTLDGLVQHESSGELWVLEHKTYSRKPKLVELMLSDQVRFYIWSVEQLTGLRIAGSIYDGMYKKQPLVPRMLQSGKMSTAAIETTPEVYTAALLANGLNPADYADHIKKIADNLAEDNPFFTRQLQPANRDAISQMPELLRDVYLDMNNNPRIYPHRPWDGCGRCPVKSICDAMLLGEDVDAARADFHDDDPYGTYANEAIEVLDLTGVL